jgi:hypothetical protein
MRLRAAVMLALAWAATEDAAARSEMPCSAYWHAPAVFVGRVDAIARSASGRRITFTVTERFKGPAASALTLSLDSSSPCASRFRQGREYVVYAVPQGEVLTIACGRTRDVEDGAADLSYARAVKDGTAPDGSISGQVVISRRDLAGTIVQPAHPASDVAVRVAKDGADDRAITNQAGDFISASRGPGSYGIAIDVPSGYYVESSPAAVELRDVKACAQIEVRLAYDGRLAGRVIDSSGRAIAGLTVDVFTPNLAQRKVALTDRDGRFEATRMPPGKFVVGVTSAARTTSAKPARIYFPGQVNSTAATRVTIAEGARVQLPDFRLPASIRYVVVEGFVLDADGRPAEGAQVYLKGAGEGDRIVGEPVAADFVGRFAVAAIAGTEYAIFAERKRGTRADSTDQIRVNPTEAQKPLTLVLRRRY